MLLVLVLRSAQTPHQFERGLRVCSGSYVASRGLVCSTPMRAGRHARNFVHGLEPRLERPGQQQKRWWQTVGIAALAWRQLTARRARAHDDCAMQTHVP